MNTITDVTERAMLASVKISYWTARKFDRKVSDKVAADHSAKPDAGRYTKALVAREVLEDVMGAISGLRQFHAQQTLPWSDKGQRILPAEVYFPYMEEMSKLKSDFDRAAAMFVSNYEAYVEEAKDRLGTMFEPGDYPPVGEIAAKFDVEIAILPIPTGADFRVKLGKEDEKRIREEIEEHVRLNIEVAMDDVWDRLRTTVETMKDKLENYAVDPTTHKVIGGVFRDSLVENLRDLVQLLPVLNLTGDKEMDRIRRELENSLCIYDAEELREDPRLRADQMKKADDILALFGVH